MAEKYYAVWMYSLKSGKWTKGYYSPVFSSKTDAESFAQGLARDYKTRGTCVIRCFKNNSNGMIALNGGDPVPHYMWSKEQKKVIHNKDMEKRWH